MNKNTNTNTRKDVVFPLPTVGLRVRCLQPCVTWVSVYCGSPEESRQPCLGKRESSEIEEERVRGRNEKTLAVGETTVGDVFACHFV